MRTLIASTLALAAMALFALPQAALAQTCADNSNGQCTVTATATIDIGEVLYLDIGSQAISFDPPTVNDFNNGYAQSTTPTTITHAGNVPHDVTLQAAADFFNYSGTLTDPKKPATDLNYSLGSGYSNVPDTGGSPASLHGGNNVAAGEYTGHETVDWRIDLTYADDVAGTYTLDVNFTIVAN